MFRLDIFSARKVPPKTLRVTVAVYPDGHEVRITRAVGCGQGMWTYDRGAAAGPGKANAIQSAVAHGARIECRTVPNPAYRGA